MKILLLLLGMFFASIFVGNAQTGASKIEIGNLSSPLLESLILQKINAHRSEKKLTSLKNNEALAKADIYNEHIESYWRSLIKSGMPDADLHKYKAAVQLAKAKGFAYKTSYELAQAPLEEIIERLSGDIKTKEDAAAVLGGIDKPAVTLLDCDT